MKQKGLKEAEFSRSAVSNTCCWKAATASSEKNVPLPPSLPHKRHPTVSNIIMWSCVIMTHPSLLETLCPGSTTLLISYYSVKNYCLSWPPSFLFVCPFVSKTPSYLLIYHLYVSSAVWKAFQSDRAVFLCVCVFPVSRLHHVFYACIFALI